MISAENLTAVAMDAALLMIVAVAQMLVLLTRNIDLSVASVIVWWRLGQRSRAATGDQPFLNRRADGYAGRVFTLEKPVVNGSGIVVTEGPFDPLLEGCGIPTWSTSDRTTRTRAPA